MNQKFKKVKCPTLFWWSCCTRSWSLTICSCRIISERRLSLSTKVSPPRACCRAAPWGSSSESLRITRRRQKSAHIRKVYKRAIFDGAANPPGSVCHQLFTPMLKIQRTRLDCFVGEIIRVDNAKSCAVCVLAGNKSECTLCPAAEHSSRRAK